MGRLIENLKNKYNLLVHYLHHNSEGKNVAFEIACKQEVLGVDFEYTAPGMPQQIGHVKQKFATIFNWVHAMLNGGKFTTYLQNGLWAEAVNTVMLLKNNLLTPHRHLSPFQQFLGRETEASCLQCKNLEKYVFSPTRITHTGLNYTIKALLIYGLAMLKVIPLVHTGFFNLKTKNIILPRM